MSKWRERIKSVKGRPERGGDAAADYEAFPNLSDALCGVLTSDGKGWESPPQSITVWVEGGTLKFCIGTQSSPIKTFGTFPTIAGGFDGIEQSLENGHCEEKNVSKSNRT